MTHKDLVLCLAESIKCEPEQVESLLDSLAVAIREYCMALDSIAIPGFGTFQPIKTDEHIITDSEGNRTLLPPTISITFKPSVVLKKQFV